MATSSQTTGPQKLNLPRALTRTPLFVVVILICVFWSIPTFGLLISSFRTPQEINRSGWWAIFSLERDNPAYLDLERPIVAKERNITNAQRDIRNLEAVIAENQPILASDSTVESIISLTQTALVDSSNSEAAQTRLTAIEASLTEVSTAESALVDSQAAYDAAGGTEGIIDGVRDALTTAENALKSVRADENVNRAFQNIALGKTAVAGIPSRTADARRAINNARRAIEDTEGVESVLAALDAADAALAPALHLMDAQDSLVSAKRQLGDNLGRAQEAVAALAVDSPSETLQTALTQLTAITIIKQSEGEIARTQARLESNQAGIAQDRAAVVASGEPPTIKFGSTKWREQWTIDNYDRVLNSQNMATAFYNSLLVTIPSVVIPITMAAFAAFAFAWMEFPGKNFFFSVVVVLMVVPLHIALVPILRFYVGLKLNGTYLGIWLAHTGFGMPLAIYLLYGYISTIPREIIESAKVDGASPFTTFTRLIIPLSVPAIASFAIFQFLWVWNDLLVALVFLGTRVENRVVTRALSELVGSRGQDWELLTAGAFVTMFVPLLVFLSLQRYFVRGMMAGSVKG